MDIEKQEILKNKSCFVCGGNNFKETTYPSTYFNNRLFQYLQCSNCKIVHLSEKLNNVDYEKLYSSSYHSEFYNELNDSYDFYFQQIIEKLNSNYEILDYGCGNASFLKFLYKKGFSKITGVEFNRDYIKRLNEDSDITFNAIDDFNTSSKKYDVIFLNDVLEHLTEPVNNLTKITNKLADNGLLIMTGPLEYNANIAFYFRKFFFFFKKILTANIASHKPYHYFFSNYENQKQMIENANINTLKYKIYEDYWPFISNYRDIKNLSTFIQYFIGKLSVMISSFIPKWGNRFIYIGIKK